VISFSEDVNNVPNKQEDFFDFSTHSSSTNQQLKKSHTMPLHDILNITGAAGNNNDLTPFEDFFAETISKTN
jgi:hypothetical protein